MATGQPRSAVKRAGGAALMLLGVALLGWGTHYLAINGTCSSTGYSSYGPVPTCHGAEGLYIAATFFAGPLVMLTGWGLAGLTGLLWPLTCVFVAAALFTIRLGQNVAPSGRTFGLVAGAAFLALAVLSVVTTARKRLRPAAGNAGRPGPPLSAATPAAPGIVIPAPYHWPEDRAPAEDAPPASDPLGRVERLARLRESGALTQDELDREKAKLLPEM